MRLQTLLDCIVIAEIFSAKARCVARAGLLLLRRARVNLSEGRHIGCQDRTGRQQENGQVAAHKIGSREWRALAAELSNLAHCNLFPWLVPLARDRTGLDHQRASQFSIEHGRSKSW